MVIAIILAGGTGTRINSEIPKQYIEIEGKKIVYYCMDTIFSMQEVDFVRIVATKEWHNTIEDCIEDKYRYKFLGFSNPGENRQESIWNALKDTKEFVEEKTVVIVHDAARPMVSKRLLSSGIEALKSHDGAMPVIPMKDTIYYTEDGKTVSSLVNREKVVSGQAPEFFDFGLYFEANARLVNNSKIKDVNGSTEPAVMAGMDVVLIPGEESNFKITTDSDLDRFEQYLKVRKL